MSSARRPGMMSRSFCRTALSALSAVGLVGPGPPTGLPTGRPARRQFNSASVCTSGVRKQPTAARPQGDAPQLRRCSMHEAVPCRIPSPGSPYTAAGPARSRGIAPGAGPLLISAEFAGLHGAAVVKRFSPASASCNCIACTLPALRTISPGRNLRPGQSPTPRPLAGRTAVDPCEMPNGQWRKRIRCARHFSTICRCPPAQSQLQSARQYLSAN